PRSPILLVIDDLDRCKADRVVKLLETVHTLLRHRHQPRYVPRWRAPAPLIVLVLADGRWIRTAFETEYGPFDKLGPSVHGLGADCRQKLCDHTVLVPALAADQVTAMLDIVTAADTGAGTDRAPARPAPGSAPQPPARTAENPRSERALRDAPQVIRDTPADAQRSEEVDGAVGSPDLTPQHRVELEVARVAKEASPQATARRADHLIAHYASSMPANPRLIKRVANAWEMLLAVQSHLHPGRPTNHEPHDVLVRAAILYVRFPTLVDDL